MKKIIGITKQIFKVKIKFLDNAIFLNSMFRDCQILSSVYNFQNINTKYLKTIYQLFCKCSLLLNIDDISNWNINNINYDFFIEIYFLEIWIIFQIYFMNVHH